ncbi:MAG: hypothetical protein LQ341_001322 [Variospora aurantia]|nr:MAG: hypothetical protein LQ341_001322 [Variospora aurantia]
MVHLNADGKRSLGSGIAFTILAAVAVTLRLFSKVYTKAPWAADDSWAVLSLIALFAWMAVEFWGIFTGGGGENIQTIVIEHKFAILQNYIKSLYMLDPLYALTVTAVKLSILYLYRRIFAVQAFKQISFAVAAACVVWWVVFTITALIPCRPVRKFWQPQIEGHCYNFNEFFLGASIVDILLDAVILSLPIKKIVGLQMPYKRKVMLCFVFLVGGLDVKRTDELIPSPSSVIITGIVRTSLIYVPGSQNSNFPSPPSLLSFSALPALANAAKKTVNFTQGELWTNIHLGTAVFCACLPTFPPLLTRLGVVGSSLLSKLGSIFSTARPLKDSSDTSTLKHYDKLTGPAAEGKFSRETAVGRSQSGHSEAEWEMGRIVVKNTVDIV